MKSLLSGKRADVVCPRSPLGLRPEKRLFLSMDSFRGREPNCASPVCARHGGTGRARRRWRPGGPGRSSRLPPSPLSPAAPELHSSQPRLVALRVGARRPPTLHAVQATFRARAGETPTRLLPSYRRPLPGGRASASAPCSCFPPPGGSGSLVHSTRGNHSHARGSSWDAEGTEADRPRRRGTFTHRRAGGDDLAAGVDGWPSALLQRPALPPVMLAGGAKGRQQAAAAAEQLLGYADCPVYPAPSPRPVSPPSS